MSEDPIRLLDTVTEELLDLRTALREASALTPSEPTIAQLTARVHEALDAPKDIAPPADMDDLDPPEFEPPSDPHARESLSVAIEASETDSLASHEGEIEIAGGLTASLLAAGAAIVWLHRRSTESSPERAGTAGTSRGDASPEDDDDGR